MTENEHKVRAALYGLLADKGELANADRIYSEALAEVVDRAMEKIRPYIKTDSNAEKAAEIVRMVGDGTTELTLEGHGGLDRR